MKIVITYKAAEQISPDSFRTITKVIHLEPTDTMEQVFKKVAPIWENQQAQEFDGEIHFDNK
ncbi:MAG: hypothetical protein PHY56_00220 [Candidatus Omnitrophica bacterium]|nr:hypothetical protein [Candidatus Omnitrophota bacterium]